MKGVARGGGMGYYVLGARDYPVVKSQFYSTVLVVFKDSIVQSNR